MTITNQRFLIGIVGPCAAGKSTLVAGLGKHGCRTRHIAQEHSHVKDMWQRLTNPDLLIFLDVSYPVSLERQNLNWNKAEYDEQKNRLQHAREHADFYLNTDTLTPQDVLAKALRFIKEANDAPND